MKISVIIATKDRINDIIQCINSIVSQSLLPDEIIVVDASEKIELQDILSNLITERIKFVYLHTKPGLTYQRNRGIEVVSGDIVCFFDDDVILDKNYLKVIYDFFKNNQEVGGVTGKIVNVEPLKTISIIFRKVFCLSEFSKGEIKPSWSNNFISGKIKKPIKVDWLQGANQCYRNEVFETELFDESLQGYCYMEDVDFSYRVSKHYPLYYLPDAKCIHNHKSAPSTRMKKREKQFMFMINYHYLFKKNMKQSFINKFCHYWSFVGFIIRGIFFERNIDFTIGVLKGIWINIIGKNPLLKGSK